MDVNSMVVEIDKEYKKTEARIQELRGQLSEAENQLQRLATAKASLTGQLPVLGGKKRYLTPERREVASKIQSLTQFLKRAKGAEKARLEKERQEFRQRLEELKKAGK